MRWSRIRISEALAAAVLVLATVIVCWPWAHSGQHVFVQWDALFTQLALDHMQRSLMGEHGLLSAPFGWPMQDPMTQSDWLLGQALLGLPLRLIGATPYRLHNLLVVLGLFGTAWGCHRLAHSLLGPGQHTWVAGIVGGLSPLHLAHAQHLNLVHHEVAVGGGMLLAGGLMKGRPGFAAAGGLLLGTAAHFGAYIGAQAMLVAGIVLAGCALWRCPGRRTWAFAAAGLLLGLLTVLPVASAYLRAAERYDLWLDPARLDEEVWDPATTLSPTPTAPLHDQLSAGGSPIVPMVPANPGYGVLLLGALGLFTVVRRQERPRRWLLVGVIGAAAALLALGPQLTWNGEGTGIPGPYRLLSWLPGYRGLQAPGRWLALASCALAVFAAAGYKASAARIPWAPARVGLAGGVLALLITETPRTHTSPHWEVTQDGDAQLLSGTTVAGAQYEVFPDEPTCRGTVRSQLWAALDHRRPLAGRTCARHNMALYHYRQLADSWPAQDALILFQITGVRVVVEHPPYNAAEPSGASCRRQQRHRICVLDDPLSTPLLPPAAIQEDPAGPVIGLRWPRDMKASEFEVRCPDQWQTKIRLAPWRIVTDLRHGGHGEELEIFFDQPCDGTPAGMPGDPVFLYADPDHDAAPWLTP